VVTLRGHPGAGPEVEAEALVCHDNFSARYDVNRRTGVFSRETHALYGISLVGKVCVFDTAKGGVATAWALLDMKQRGVAPAALIFRTTNPIMVQGAVLAGIPIMDRLEPDPLDAISTGDRVRVRPAEGLVEVRRPARA
jgi:predicted aconitase with swiveling domain